MFEDPNEKETKPVYVAPKRTKNLIASLTEGSIVVRDDKVDLSLQEQSTSGSSGANQGLSPEKQISTDSQD